MAPIVIAACIVATSHSGPKSVSAFSLRLSVGLAHSVRSPQWRIALGIVAHGKGVRHQTHQIHESAATVWTHDKWTPKTAVGGSVPELVLCANTVGSRGSLHKRSGHNYNMGHQTNDDCRER